MDWNQIAANPWIGFAGTVFGILGIIVSAIIYFRTRKYQQPAYLTSSIRWYDGANVPHTDVQLTFRGKSIPRFTITRLVFWNAGNQTIRESDFAPVNSLGLEIPKDVEVFDIRITAITAQDIHVFLESAEVIEAGEKKIIPIHFDYLDGDDGFSIQVIHDSKFVSAIRFAGKLPGVAKFKSNSFNSSNKHFLLSRGFRSKVLHSSPMQRLVFIPLIFFGLGGLGIWSIYLAIFREFHWYQVLGGFMVSYLFMPFLLFSELNPPKALADAALEKGEEPLK